MRPWSESIQLSSWWIAISDELMTEAVNAENPNYRLHVGFEAFKARRHAKVTCVIRDRTYGTMQVYLLPDASSR